MGLERKPSELERRRYKRYRVEFAVKVHFSLDGKRSSYQASGTNISDGGMQLLVPRDLMIGQAIRLELALPYGHKTLNLRAVIRNRMSFKYGVEFLNLSESEREIILQNCRVLALLQ